MAQQPFRNLLATIPVTSKDNLNAPDHNGRGSTHNAVGVDLGPVLVLHDVGNSPLHHDGRKVIPIESVEFSKKPLAALRDRPYEVRQGLSVNGKLDKKALD